VTTLAIPRKKYIFNDWNNKNIGARKEAG